VGPLYSTLKLLGFNYNLAHSWEAKQTNSQPASQPVSQPKMFLAPSPTAQSPPTMAGEVPPPRPLAYMGFVLCRKNLFISELAKNSWLLEGKQATQTFSLYKPLCPHKGPLGVIEIEWQIGVMSVVRLSTLSSLKNTSGLLLLLLLLFLFCCWQKRYVCPSKRSISTHSFYFSAPCQQCLPHPTYTVN